MSGPIPTLLSAYLEELRRELDRIPRGWERSPLVTKPTILEETGETIIQVLVKVVSSSGDYLTIRQQDHAQRWSDFRVQKAKYMCRDPDDQPQWWLENSTTTHQRHFQKRPHTRIIVPWIDIQRLTSLDMLDVFRIFCESGRTLEELTEADLHGHWRRFPQS